ncbi:MAG: hypothetical protein V4655_13075 [Bdellovibrionota bacterium]
MNRATLKLVSLCALLGFLPSLAFGQGGGGGFRSSISRDFRKEEKSQSPGFEILNRSISNHAIASTLASNAGEINRTVESLMESLFYSIMDQTATIKMSDTLNARASYEREVQPTGIGSYVVYDRFKIGPDLIKPLGEIRALPLTFRNQNNLFLTNVSYRSDAQRKANSQTRSGWREFANNWFGAVPFLTRILPPSFNPEELYDPISYLGTPFLFPNNYQQALQMPLGTVRSYGLSGSAGVSIDTAGKVAQDIQESLNLGDLTLSIPVGTFLEGEHRISILHTRDNEIWLAVSEIRQFGGILNFSLGERYQLLQKLVSWWTGSVATIAPIDFELERSKILQKDELYTFDLSKSGAQEALNKALNGDLSLAKAQSSMPAQADESGVHFEFRRISDRGEDSTRQARSFFVLQSQKRATINNGENTLLDGVGQTVSLEAEHAVQDRDWNVLTGAETVDVNFRFSLPVLKKVKSDQTFYRLADTDETNYLVANIKIIDRFHDTRDFERSVNMLRSFSHLTLDSVPKLPIYAEDLEAQLLRQQAFINPMETAFRKDVSPTHLGRFEAFSHVYIDQETIKYIGKLDPSAFWQAYAASFHKDQGFWGREGQVRGSTFYLHWLGSFAVMPTRLFNFDTGYSDLVYEGQRLYSALQTIAEATEPLEIIEAYRQLMDTRHPAELLNTLNELSPVEIPVVVGLSTSADNNKGDTEDMKKTKATFAKLNNKQLQSNVSIPTLKRNQSAEEKLAAFTPGGYKDDGDIPNLRKLTLTVVRLPPDPTPRLFAHMEVSGAKEDADRMQAYVRVEENGPLSLGRFVLGEEVKNIRWVGKKNEGGELRQVYELELNGASGLAQADFFDKALNDKGAFDLYMSVSNQEDNWSQEHKLSFDIQNGLLQAF